MSKPLAVDCNISSFTGSEAILNLTPIVYFLSVIAIGIGLIGVGALGMAGRGALAGGGGGGGR